MMFVIMVFCFISTGIGEHFLYQNQNIDYLIFFHIILTILLYIFMQLFYMRCSTWR